MTLYASAGLVEHLSLLLCYPSKLLLWLHHTPEPQPYLEMLTARPSSWPGNAQWCRLCEQGCEHSWWGCGTCVWAAQAPLADTSLPLPTQIFLFPAQQAGSLWEIGGMPDEGTHRMCEMINLSPPLEAQLLAWGSGCGAKLWLKGSCSTQDGVTQLPGEHR